MHLHINTNPTNLVYFMILLSIDIKVIYFTISDTLDRTFLPKTLHFKISICVYNR